MFMPNWISVIFVFVLMQSSHCLRECTSNSSYDDVWVRKPPTAEIGCAGHNLEMHCCAKGHEVNWKKYSSFAQMWEELDATRHLDLESGQRLILTNATRQDDGSRYRCQVRGTDHSAERSIQIKDCDRCYRQIFQYPEEKLTSLTTLPGNKISFHCQIFVGCSSINFDTTVIWSREARNGSDYQEIETNGNIPRHTLNNSLINGNVVSQVTIEPVTEEDYGYDYTCSGREAFGCYRLIHGIPRNSPILEPKAGYVIAPIVAPILISILLILIYIYRFHIRSFARHFMKPECNRDVLSINSTTSSDVNYVKHVLSRRLEGEWGLRMIVNFRDFLAANNDESFIEFLRDGCSRVIVLLSNHFLRDPECNRAFELAYTELDIKVTFLCIEELTEWNDQIHTVLRERLRNAGMFYSPYCKLIWQPEFSRDRQSTRGLFSFIRKMRIGRAKSIFWRRLRLAMPRNVPRVKSRSEIMNGLNMVDHEFQRQSSEASNIVLHI